jgi:hypothetical protein
VRHIESLLTRHGKTEWHGISMDATHFTYAVVALHFARRHRGLWTFLPLEAPYSDLAAVEAAAKAVAPTMKSPRVTEAMVATRLRQYFDELAGNLARRQRAHRESVKGLKAQLEAMKEQQMEFVKTQIIHRAVESGVAAPARAAAQARAPAAQAPAPAAAPPAKVAVRRPALPSSSSDETSSESSSDSDVAPPPRRRARGRPAAARTTAKEAKAAQKAAAKAAADVAKAAKAAKTAEEKRKKLEAAQRKRLQAQQAKRAKAEGTARKRANSTTRRQ